MEAMDGDEGEAQQSLAQVGDGDLIVSGVPEGITEEDLRDLFSIHGSLSEVKVMNGPTGLMGIVRYADQASAKTALELMDGHLLLDKPMSVRFRMEDEAWEELSWEQANAAQPPPQAEPPQAAPRPSKAPRRPNPPDAGMPAATEDRTGCNLVVFNVPDAWSTEDFTLLCQAHARGSLMSAEVFKDRGPSRAYGLVSFLSRAKAVTAMAGLQGIVAGDRSLRVEVKARDFEVQLRKGLLSAAGGGRPRDNPWNQTGTRPAAQPAATPGGRAAAAAAPAGLAAEPQVRDSIAVPEVQVRALIGKEGQTLRHLCRQTEVEIDVARRSGGEEQTDRLVTLGGTAFAIEKAKRLIQATLRSAREIRPGDPNADVIRVGAPVCREVIGHGGAKIGNIRKESGARVEMVMDEANKENRLIIISGPDECVDYAAAQVLKIVKAEEERQAGNTSMPKPAGRPNGDIEVPNSLVGTIMGKGGEKIRNISKDTDTTITSQKQKSGNRLIHISGKPANVERARRMIEAQIGDLTTKVVHMHKKAIGPFIGRGGENINHLSETTGCKIRIPKHEPENSEGDLRKVELSGTKEGVGKVTKAIREFLEENGYDAPESDFGPRRKEVDAFGENFVSEKLYIDELDLNGRFLWEDAQDGLPHDVEIFIRGLPIECQEEQLYDHICSLGASDVQEILLLRRGEQSKGAAYVLFYSHEGALLAKSKLHDAPAASVMGKEAGGDEAGSEGQLSVWFSESERVVKGERGTYGEDLVKQLLGPKGANMTKLKTAGGLRHVVMTGAQTKFFGKLDADPRTHLIIQYEHGQDEAATKTAEAWGDQLRELHEKSAEKRQKKSGSGGGDAPKVEPVAEEAAAASDPEAAKVKAEAEGEAEAEGPGSMHAVVHLASSGEDQEHMLSGHYVEFGEHQDRPVYKKTSEDVPEGEAMDASGIYLYFLPADDDVGEASWWFGSAISGDEVWAKCTSDETTPPKSGWLLLEGETEGLELEVRPGPPNGKKRRHKKRKVKHHRDRGSDGQKAEEVPQWQATGTYPALPPNWVCVPYGAHCYYVNRETGERTWYPPHPVNWAPDAGADGAKDVGTKERDAHKRRRGRSQDPGGDATADRRTRRRTHKG